MTAEINSKADAFELRIHAEMPSSITRLNADALLTILKRIELLAFLALVPHALAANVRRPLASLLALQPSLFALVDGSAGCAKVSARDFSGGNSIATLAANPERRVPGLGPLRRQVEVQLVELQLGVPCSSGRGHGHGGGEGESVGENVSDQHCGVVIVVGCLIDYCCWRGKKKCMDGDRGRHQTQWSYRKPTLSKHSKNRQWGIQRNNA